VAEAIGAGEWRNAHGLEDTTKAQGLELNGSEIFEHLELA